MQEIPCVSAVEDTPTIDSSKVRVEDAIKRLEKYSAWGKVELAVDAEKERTSQRINATLDGIEVRAREWLCSIIYISILYFYTQLLYYVSI